MSLISDLFLIAGALAAGFYCFVLSRRLSAFSDAENGVGQVVASLSKQVDDLNNSIKIARVEAGASSDALNVLTTRAEGVAQRLELMVASMHDIPTSEGERAKGVVETDSPIPKAPVFSTRMSAERKTQ